MNHHICIYRWRNQKEKNYLYAHPEKFFENYA